MQLHLPVENLSARLEDAQAAAQRLQSALATEASNAKASPFLQPPDDSMTHGHARRQVSGLLVPWLPCYWG